ncbi:MAG: DUF169 domain-containing protein [Acidobacteriota bacterium]
MRSGLRDEFLDRWQKYFPNAEMPIAFYYTDLEEAAPFRIKPEGHHCFIDDLEAVRHGETLCFDTKSIACFGGKQYLGFTQNRMPDFEYFLSCGIPGKLEGERYKKTPELVRSLFQADPDYKAAGKFVVFKRWDVLTDNDPISVVVFFAPPDVLSGLFTLANYDEPTNEAVFSPMGAGCATIVKYPLKESLVERPRAVLGMFDVSARPGVPSTSLSFSVPAAKFERMVDNMDESFLITESWKRVRQRLL